MKTISQVAKLTGVSIRTLQYYDEIDSYSNDYVKNITDKKCGDGASDYIVKAFRYYSENNTPSKK